MAFNDRYSITSYKTKPHGRASLSIDNNGEGVKAILLLIPELDNPEHDHFQFDKDLLKVLKAKLALKGTVKNIQFPW